MAKKITATLPKGTLVFPKLNKVDDFKGKRTFKTRIKFDDENHRKVDAWLKKAAKELGQADAKLPWYKDKKTGELTLKASSGEKYPPALLDAKGREVPRAKVEVGGGTIAKVDVTAAYYEGFGGGINLYMNFVQIIELPRTFVRTPAFVGPDRRRRRRDSGYNGPKRRSEDKGITTEYLPD